MLTAGRWAIHRSCPLQAYTRWPGGVLSFSRVLALFGAARWIGIHAIFGSFIAGVALGDSPHLRERARDHRPVRIVRVRPVFFASIGLRVSFRGLSMPPWCLRFPPHLRALPVAHSAPDGQHVHA